MSENLCNNNHFSFNVDWCGTSQVRVVWTITAGGDGCGNNDDKKLIKCKKWRQTANQGCHIADSATAAAAYLPQQLFHLVPKLG